ncbi:zinc finger BED domain-containing protein 5-like [Acyrthosiphon pisum]|uniref:Zinc finger BED domain-containing protein 5 n=1 Tax=Acyrthosiphon pisum TaxID=7029 RepID=A0A8R2F6P1_ACYPI|nr:zinc finger BED domain-containing protein 5-like [Acyrthosiphon pisum]|eukprot:XP_008181076.1 PREDICTED: zinc finger BED domain-containing protein 5-like [Acyrthosiphon pisum]
MASEAHTIAETLIKPCVIDIVTCMLDDKSAKHLSIIPLSNNTVARRIKDLACNVSETLVSRIKYTKFALQMDESTDIAGLAVLLVFVRYVNMNSFEEDIYFIPWTNCIDVCTDGARAMTGATAGAIAKIKEKSNETTSSHCILHRHALAMKNIPLCLKNYSKLLTNQLEERQPEEQKLSTFLNDLGKLRQDIMMNTNYLDL